MAKNINKNTINFRFNVLTILIYIVGIVLIAQLFNLQIVHGTEYREQSNTRLTRESTLKAARGDILDKTGNVLVSSKMVYSLELYKTKIDTVTLNDTILNIIQVLEKYDVSYTDDFPISVEPFLYEIEGETLTSWLESNKLDENLTAEQVFYEFKDKYKIQQTDIQEVRKIIAIRYAITKDGYSSTKSLKIASNIPDEAVAEFSESGDKFPGINIIVEPMREYKQGTLASHILGYAGKITDEEYKTRKDNYTINDLIGKTGIEGVFEEYLKGQDGIKQIDMAVDGTITAEYVSKEAIGGSDVVLTIDANLQRIAEEALANNIQKIASGGFGKVYDAKAGSCVVMNVKTGEVLAMVSYPSYNPQDFVGGISTQKWNEYNSEEANNPLLNRAIQSANAPGSIYKMITGIAALESNVVSLTEKINDTGVYKKYGSAWNCWYYTDYHRGHGYVDIAGAIQKSCNYYFIEVADRMGIDNLAKYAKMFGLGKKTGIELPSETAGTVAQKKEGEVWNPGGTLNASIGQGDNAFTALQMTKYISILANGGNNIDVTIVKSIINQDGTEVSRNEINELVNKKLGIESEEVGSLGLNQEYLKVILNGMQSVTSEVQGTAYNIFRDFDIKVGGKTGSAEAGKDKNNNDIVNAWFAGFAPFDDPEIAIVVMVENGGHGNYTAEVVRDIMKEYFGMNTQNVEEDLQVIPYTQNFR